jgi:hypothetical protein
MIWFLLPFVIGLFAILSDSEKEKLLKLLPSITKLMYSFANIDGIKKIEEDKIIEFYSEILKELEKESSLLNKVPLVRNKIKKIIDNKNDIKLSEALSELEEIGGYKDLFKKLKINKEKLIEITKADGIVTNPEKEIIRRYNLFLESNIKSQAIDKIKQLEEEDLIPVPEHYKYENKKSPILNFAYKKEENGLILLYKNSNNFKNIDQLVENEYYILHPNDSNYLYPISKINTIKDEIINEIANIISSIGATEVKIDLYRAETIIKTSNKKTFANIDTNVINANMNNTSNNSNNESTLFTRVANRKYKTGKKEDKALVLSKQIWTKGDSKINDLIESVYSNNPLVEWEEELYVKIFVKNINSTTFNASVKIAKLYELDLNIDSNSIKEFEKLSEERLKISIKF